MEENNCLSVSLIAIRGIESDETSAILCCNSQIYRSSIRAALTEPFNETFTFDVSSARKELAVLVEQHTDHGDIIVGRVTLPLSSLPFSREEHLRNSFEIKTGKQEEVSSTTVEEGSERYIERLNESGGKVRQWFLLDDISEYINSGSEIEQPAIELDLQWKHKHQTNLPRLGRPGRQGKNNFNQLVVRLIQAQELPISTAKARRHNGETCNPVALISFMANFSKSSGCTIPANEVEESEQKGEKK